ncbi:MAG: hypothetical protein AAGI54_07890 [Planctomycetota bacterium]
MSGLSFRGTLTACCAVGAFAVGSLTDAEVVLENDDLRVVIDEDGGIVKSMVFKATGWDVADPSDGSKWQGVAKDRLGVGGDGQLVRSEYAWGEATDTTARGETVVDGGWAKGTRIEKSFRLEGAALRVEATVTAGAVEIPLLDVHNYLPGFGVHNSDGFFYADAEGIGHYRKSGDASAEVDRPTWYATMADEHGLLARFEEPMPATLYSYLGAEETALEWYYPRLAAGQTTRFAYTLHPFSASSMPDELHEAIAQAERQNGSGSGPVAHVPPLTTKRPVLSPRKSGYAFVSNIEQIAYVSADTPSMIHFRPINPSHQPDLYLAVPEGITVHGGYRGLDFIDAGTRQIDGKPFRVTKVALGANPSKYTIIWQADASAGWTPGEELRGYFWGAWSQGEQAPQPLTIQMVEVPKVEPFETIPVWMSQPSDLMAIWPDMTGLRDMGFNYMDLWTYTRAGSERDQWGERTLLESRNRLAEAGIETIAWVREWWWHDGQRDGDDGRAMTIDGNRVDSLNLTYRGQYFDELIEQGKYLIDQGMYFHSVDPEIYRDGDKIDFSPRTIGAFREYLTTQAPDVRYKSPIRFERAPEDHPELHRHWNAFKAQCYADFFNDYRAAMETHMREQGIDSPFLFMAMTTYHRQWDGLYDYADYRDSPVYRITLEDPAMLAEAFDYLAPMIYTDVYANYNPYDMKLPWKDTIVLRRIVGDEAAISPLLCAGYPFFDAFGSDLPAPLLKANMLETVAGGGKGFGIWGECPIDALDMRVTAEVVGMLQPYERLIVSGEPSDEIQAPSGDVFVKRLTSPYGSLVLVSEYSNEVIETTVHCPVDVPSRVIDLSTGEMVGELDHGTAEFAIRLNGERAVMYAVVPR